MEAIRHLREAGFNEPAENLEKMAHKMKEEFERRHKEFAEHARGPEGEGRRKRRTTFIPRSRSTSRRPTTCTINRCESTSRWPSWPWPRCRSSSQNATNAGPEGGPSPRGELQAIASRSRSSHVQSASFAPK